jgi:hypothetical protein
MFLERLTKPTVRISEETVEIRIENVWNMRPELYSCAITPGDTEVLVNLLPLPETHLHVVSFYTD